jgi:uncharacterized protein
LNKKVAALRALLSESAPVLVALSGGVDSTVLLHVALEELGSEGVLAVTAHGDVHSDEELAAARAAAARMGVRHTVIETHELEAVGFSENPPERCYLCRHHLYQKLGEVAWAYGMKTLVDGATGEGGEEYRPSIEAARVLGVRSPLAEVGLGRDEVRALAKKWDLPEWDRPSSPCLASRFPYGQAITREGLAMVTGAERYLHGLGFDNVRVRHHGDIARIEIGVDDMSRLIGPSDVPGDAEASARRGIVGHLGGLGYRFVALDLQGLQSGSPSQVLEPAAAKEE